MLKNPDVEFRYDIPNLLAGIESSTITDNRGDYSNDYAPLLVIYLTSDYLDSDVCLAIEYLRNHEVLRNFIPDAVEVYSSLDGKKKFDFS